MNIVEKIDKEGEVLRRKPTHELNNILHNRESEISRHMEYKMKQIQRERALHCGKSECGELGVKMFEKYIKPHLTHTDTHEEYEKIQLWGRGALITTNPKHHGYHANVNGHAMDLKAAYVYEMCGKVPTGGMLDGRGMEKDDINLIAIDFSGVQTKKEYLHSLPPLFVPTQTIACEPYPDSDNKIKFTKDVFESKRVYNGNNTTQKITYYMFEEELEEMKEFMRFSDDLTVRYLYHYKSTLDTFTDTMEYLYAERGKTVEKGGICACMGCCAKKPKKKMSKLKKDYISWGTTYAILFFYVVMKCKIRMLRMIKTLADLGNTVISCTTDCIYYIGETRTEQFKTTTGLGSWSGGGDGVFITPFCDNTKEGSDFDSYYLESACAGAYEYAGYRIKTSHGTLRDEKNIIMTFMDILPLNEWGGITTHVDAIKKYCHEINRELECEK